MVSAVDKNTPIHSIISNGVRHPSLKVKHATWGCWGLSSSATPLPSFTAITLTSSFISDIIHSCPPLHPLPLFPADGESHLLDVLWACETADWFDSASDSYLSAVPTPPLSLLPSVSASFYHCVSLLKANLVAAFEQSLALMTARLQTLSVSSEQKVSWWYHDGR